MAKLSALGRGLGALLSEIEDAYSDEDKELNKNARLFVESEINKLSKKDIDFINSFSTFTQKEVAVKTIQYIQKKPQTTRTHSHQEVMQKLNEIKSESKNKNVSEVISATAKILNMTTRAVKKHYYLKK